MKTGFKTGIIGFLAGILGAFTFSFFSPNNTNTDNFDNNPTTTSIPETGRVAVKNTVKRRITGSTDLVQAAKSSTESVVYIKTISDERYNSMDFFDMYFGGSRRVEGSGSGVIFTEDGYIVTNNHVIDNAEVIEVIHQKRSYKGKVIGTDPSSDLAIIKIEAKNLPNIKLGRSKDLQVGEWVLAVGNPFNLNSTVTAGIVSAKGRNIGILRGRFPIESFIQTDAAINPGNSGGALVNSAGELVGINTAILSRTGSYTGYGFAVPVDIVSKIFNDLIKYKQVQKAFTGLRVSDIDSKTIERFGLKDDDVAGVVITDIESGGSAEKAGLQRGDIIVKVNEENIDVKSDFDEQISYYRPGDKLNITYKRGDKTAEKQLTLTNKEGTTGFLKSEIYKSEKLGADLEKVSKVEKQKLGIDGGVRVVRAGRGILARLRMQDGMVITKINGQTIDSPQKLESVLENAGRRINIEGVNENGSRVQYSFYGY